MTPKPRKVNALSSLPICRHRLTTFPVLRENHVVEEILEDKDVVIPLALDRLIDIVLLQYP